MGSFTQLEDGSYVPAIPEPYWYRSWRTWFRLCPGCYGCNLIFKNRQDFNEHYIKMHTEV